MKTLMERLEALEQSISESAKAEFEKFVTAVASEYAELSNRITSLEKLVGRSAPAPVAGTATSGNDAVIPPVTA